MIGRLAPTPSGELHLGNVGAFGAAWLSARQAGGRLLLRIEDVDLQRSRPDVEDRIRRDLDWLGLHWDAEVPRQSARDYAPWLARLSTYRCACSRKEVVGAPYPGTCREAGHADGAARFRLPAGVIAVRDRKFGVRDVDPRAAFGDPIVRRRDGQYTYNLAVVADDVADGVTEVVRGADLLDFTAVQLRLWEAFGAPPPTFLHAPLILGPDGRKLSKSHGALAIRALREAGWSAAQVWDVVLPWLGLPPGADLASATRAFDPASGPRGPITVRAAGEGCPSPEAGVLFSVHGTEESP